MCIVGTGFGPSLCLGMASQQLFRFGNSSKRDIAGEGWLNEPGDLHSIARRWFEVMRECGDDVREVLHDGHPTACVVDAAFAYVDAFTNHVNVGFFRGAELPDPRRLLQGTGKMMRHVKIEAGGGVDDTAVEALIRTAYLDVKKQLLGEADA